MASVLVVAIGEVFGREGTAESFCENDAGGRILSTDFREMLADEGWEAADDSTRAEPIEVADDPAEYGVQIRNGAIRQVRQGSDCEILVTSGAVTPEGTIQRAHLKSKPISTAMWEMEQFTRRMRRMCHEEKAEFFDIRRAWDDYMLRSQLPFDFISRDPIHANSRGKQILARILTRYFEPKEY